MMVSEQQAHEAVETLLAYIEGEHAVNREGLQKTPQRVVDSWKEIFAGYDMDAAEILQATFNGEGYDGIVLLRNIEFTSTCEHHLQPFRGRGHIAYIPVERIAQESANSPESWNSMPGDSRTKNASPRALPMIWSGNSSPWELLSSSKHRMVACSAEVLPNNKQS